MIKLGKKEKTYSDGPISPSKQKNRVHYPSFCVDGIDLPLGTKDVGKKIVAKVLLRVNKAGSEIDEWGPNPNQKRYRADFSILGIDIGKKKKVDVSSLSSSDLDMLEKAEHDKLSFLK